MCNRKLKAIFYVYKDIADLPGFMQSSTHQSFVRIFSLHSLEDSMHLQLNLEVKDLTFLLAAKISV